MNSLLIAFSMSIGAKSRTSVRLVKLISKSEMLTLKMTYEFIRIIPTWIVRWGLVRSRGFDIVVFEDERYRGAEFENGSYYGAEFDHARYRGLG